MRPEREARSEEKGGRRTRRAEGGRQGGECIGRCEVFTLSLGRCSILPPPSTFAWYLPGLTQTDLAHDKEEERSHEYRRQVAHAPGILQLIHRWSCAIHVIAVRDISAHEVLDLPLPTCEQHEEEAERDLRARRHDEHVLEHSSRRDLNSRERLQPRLMLRQARCQQGQVTEQTESERATKAS
eukprot:768227-Hanusia_phi.AAC.2